MLLRSSGGITLFKSDLFETISVVAETDDLVLVADPSWLPREVEEIRRFVDERLSGRPLYLLFTHSDYDHVLGAAAFEGAATIASCALRDQSAEHQAAVVEMIRQFDDDYYITRPYPIVYPVIDHAIIADGETLKTGRTTMTFYQAPGHTDDGLFTVIEPLGLLIAGDYYSAIEFPYTDHSSAAYEATIGKLDRILTDHRIELLVSGHGDPASSKDEMIRRQKSAAAYIHAMRKAVASGDQATIDGLIEGHPHPRSKRQFHEANRRLFLREHQELLKK